MAGFARIQPVSGNPSEFLRIQLPLCHEPLRFCKLVPAPGPSGGENWTDPKRRGCAWRGSMKATPFALTEETSACCSPEEILGQIASLRQAVEALEREVAELRCEARYWKSRHADALPRIEATPPVQFGRCNW